MSKKIYFVAEAKVDGEVVHSDKFNQIINPDNNEQVFVDVFQITECKKFEQYKEKDDFLATVFAMTLDFFTEYGDIVEDVNIIAIESDTDIFTWGVQMDVLDDDSFQYTTYDYKATGKILKFAE